MNFTNTFLQYHYKTIVESLTIFFESPTIREQVTDIIDTTLTMFDEQVGDNGSDQPVDTAERIADEFADNHPDAHMGMFFVALWAAMAAGFESTMEANIAFLRREGIRETLYFLSARREPVDSIYANIDDGGFVSAAGPALVMLDEFQRN